ncbi:MAG: HD domain-containing protein [Desulfobacterium sp.]|nr:HD domain-containing protein [Desulfobacterium sp.]MBU3947734.1 HD domain-containing protein [Pseudomonadota bacterium]MBU4010891.1 HD domain-containing protein [Pseudomonadota bacterium]MBU4035349.1 HD domain-containing protein [Pseudomonadota bacterium]
MSEYILAKASQLNFYINIPLYHNIKDDTYVLYKPTGIMLGDMRISEGMHPHELFIKQSDKLTGLQEAQKGFNKQLENYVKSSDPAKVKETLVAVVDETLAEPRSGSLEGVSDTVGIFVSDYSRESGVINSLIDLSSKDYSSTMHSINVMALALKYSFHMNFSSAEAKLLGLCGLLHDVGKTKINNEILSAPRKLTDEEFAEMKSHTILGYKILIACKFNSKEIAACALDHHEKIDGSGYPNGKTRISQLPQIIGLIDCYEALTNDTRPYRTAMDAYNALNQIILKDVVSGKYNKNLYTNLIKSLGNL